VSDYPSNLPTGKPCFHESNFSTKSGDDCRYQNPKTGNYANKRTDDSHQNGAKTHCIEATTEWTFGAIVMKRSIEYDRANTTEQHHAGRDIQRNPTRAFERL
jgi:hypothetical protein